MINTYIKKDCFETLFLIGQVSKFVLDDVRAWWILFLLSMSACRKCTGAEMTDNVDFNSILY